MARIEDVAPSRNLGRFVSKEEKLALVVNVTPLRIVDIVSDPTNSYGARWVVGVVDLVTGERLALGMRVNTSRDVIMKQLTAYLEENNDLDPVVLVRRDPSEEEPPRNGNPYYTFRTATADEIAAAESDAEEHEQAKQAAEGLTPKLTGARKVAGK